jgi:hypothetical protein
LKWEYLSVVYNPGSVVNEQRSSILGTGALDKYYHFNYNKINSKKTGKV